MRFHFEAPITIPTNIPLHRALYSYYFCKTYFGSDIVSYRIHSYILNAGEVNGNGSSPWALCLPDSGSEYEASCTRNQVCGSLERPEDMHSSNMSVLAVHVVSEDDDLQNVAVDWLAIGNITDVIDLDDASRNAENSQFLAIFVELGGYVEGDPTGRLIECEDTHILQIV